MRTFALLAFAVVLASAALQGPACTQNTESAVDAKFHSWASQRWDQVAAEANFRKVRLESMKSSVAAYPEGKFSAAGIVMAIEHSGEVAEAYATIAGLRAEGVTAPIELWLPITIQAEQIAEFAKLNVAVKDLSTVVSRDQLASVNFRRPQVAALAMIHSSFAELVYIAPGSQAAVDTAALFSGAGYAASGLQFYPATTKPSAANPIWKIVGAACVDAFEQDASLVVVNKAKAWEALHVAVHLNGKFYQNMLNGNKDVLRMAAIATATPFVFERAAALRTSVVAVPLAVSNPVLQTCTQLTAAQIRSYANENTVIIADLFRGEPMGSTKTIEQVRSKWRPACKLFAKGTTDCDGDFVQNTQDFEVAFWNITVPTVDYRLHFWAGGYNTEEQNSTTSVIQISEFDNSGFQCDTNGFLYNKVEKTKNWNRDHMSALLITAFDIANNFPRIRVDIVNSAFSAAPSVIVLLAASLLAMLFSKF